MPARNANGDQWPPDDMSRDGVRPKGYTTFHEAGTLADLGMNGGYAPQELPSGSADSVPYKRHGTSGAHTDDSTDTGGIGD